MDLRLGRAVSPDRVISLPGAMALKNPSETKKWVESPAFSILSPGGHPPVAPRGVGNA